MSEGLSPRSKGELGETSASQSGNHVSILFIWNKILIRHHAPHAGGLGSIPGQGTRSHRLQVRVSRLQLKNREFKCSNKDPRCHNYDQMQPDKQINKYCFFKLKV